MPKFTTISGTVTRTISLGTVSLGPVSLGPVSFGPVSLGRSGSGATLTMAGTGLALRRASLHKPLRLPARA